PTRPGDGVAAADGGGVVALGRRGGTPGGAPRGRTTEAARDRGRDLPARRVHGHPAREVPRARDPGRSAARARRARRAPRPRGAAASLALAAAIGLANLLGNAAFVARHPLGVGLDPGTWPVQAVAWLRDHQTGPRVLTDLTWGNLALWHLAPSRRVALDGRNTAVYDPAWVDRYLAAWVGGDLDALL